VPDPYLGEEIVAHVVLEPEGRCDESELIRHCEERLGTLKTPARIEFAADLPRGPSGKIPRASLRERRQQESAAPSREGSPATHADIEQILCRIWAEALGRETVDVHDDFFAVGGYSLLAPRILSRMKQELSVEIPLGYFVEAPTIAEQAGIVERELQGGAGSGGSSAHERRPGSQKLNAVLLAPIDVGCTSAPLFCLYGLSRYRFLARQLGPDQPTYGLWTEQELGIASPDGLPPCFPSVAELAEAYLEDVRAIQPSGPYHLVGASFGGRVALEMAHLLHAQGEEVALIAALDTYLPGAATWRPFRWFTYHLGRSLRKGPGHPVRVLREKARKRRTRARIRQGAPVDAEGISLLAREGEFRTQARARHRLRPYAGKVVLFRALDPIWFSPGYRVDPLLGWGDVARGGLDVHDVPGSHMGILEEPHVQVLAERIRPYLQAPK
jgi:aspartate racemase